MGGFGSGGQNRKHRGKVEDHRRIDAVRMQNEGVLVDGWAGQWTWTSSDGEVNSVQLRGGKDAIRLAYRWRINGGDWKDISEAISIDWSPRHLGGAQAFFLCAHCSSRARYLYGAGARFLCRKCHGLVHASSAEGVSDRSIRKVQKLRASIGADLGLEGIIPKRPRYMRKARYERTVAAIEQAEREVMDEMLVLMRRLESPKASEGFWS